MLRGRHFAASYYAAADRGLITAALLSDDDGIAMMEYEQ